MTDKEFKSYKEWFIKDYSSDLIKSGRSSIDEACANAKEVFERLLPQGLHTKDNYIYTILSSNTEDIGIIWYKQDKNYGFIYDFLIREKYRKKGYGYEVLTEIEKDAIKKDINLMGLHVFEFNESAISLYNKLGYEVTKQDDSGKLMQKQIS